MTLAGLAVLVAVATCADPKPPELTEGLSWEFERSPTQETEGAIRVETHRFKSKKPIDRTYLRFSMRSERHPDAGSARAAFDGLLAGADPNTGLSYEWDWVVLDGARLVRVNVPCLFSQENAEKIFANARVQVLGDRSPTALFLCRCGGGCAPAPKPPE